MNSIRTYSKRRLILERLSSSDPARMYDVISRKKLERLREEEVSTVFIITSEIVDAEAYLGLVKQYESEGFRVRNIHVERLDDSAIQSVKKIVEEISEAFHHESCLILSYGRSLAPMLVACYYVYDGASPSMAIGRVRKMDGAFITNADEVTFVFKFKRSLSLMQGVKDDEYIFKPLPDEVNIKFCY